MPPTQRNQNRSETPKPAGVAEAAVDTSGADTATVRTAVEGAPKQEFQETPNPELQAALTDPEQNRIEQHIVPENANDADRRTAEAPGIRTEAEVVADHQAANEQLQAALTDPEQNRIEQHIVPENANDADRRTAEAPGIRTEAEVVADHQAANERARAALEGGHTADPAVSTSAVKMPSVENRERQVYFRNKATGRVDSVNEGTPEHGIVLGDADFEIVSRSDAEAFAKANS